MVWTGTTYLWLNGSRPGQEKSRRQGMEINGMGRGSRADKVAQQAGKTGFGVGHGSMAAQKYLVAMLVGTEGCQSPGRPQLSPLKRRVHRLAGCGEIGAPERGEVPAELRVW